MRLSALAARYGTPAFILDEADVRYRCRSYAAHWPVATGIEDQQFGFSLSSAAAADAVRRVLSHPGLDLAGFARDDQRPAGPGYRP